MAPSTLLDSFAAGFEQEKKAFLEDYDSRPAPTPTADPATAYNGGAAPSTSLTTEHSSGLAGKQLSSATRQQAPIPASVGTPSAKSLATESRQPAPIPASAGTPSTKSNATATRGFSQTPQGALSTQTTTQTAQEPQFPEQPETPDTLGDKLTNTSLATRAGSAGLAGVLNGAGKLLPTAAKFTAPAAGLLSKGTSKLVPGLNLAAASADTYDHLAEGDGTGAALAAGGALPVVGMPLMAAGQVRDAYRNTVVPNPEYYRQNHTLIDSEPLRTINAPKTVLRKQIGTAAEHGLPKPPTSPSPSQQLLPKMGHFVLPTATGSVKTAGNAVGAAVNGGKQLFKLFGSTAPLKPLLRAKQWFTGGKAKLPEAKSFSEGVTRMFNPRNAVTGKWNLKDTGGALLNASGVINGVNQMAQGDFTGGAMSLGGTFMGIHPNRNIANAGLMMNLGPAVYGMGKGLLSGGGQQQDMAQQQDFGGGYSPQQLGAQPPQYQPYMDPSQNFLNHPMFQMRPDFMQTGSSRVNSLTDPGNYKFGSVKRAGEGLLSRLITQRAGNALIDGVLAPPPQPPMPEPTDKAIELIVKKPEVAELLDDPKTQAYLNRILT